MAAGFTGPPLAREFGLRDGMRVWFDALPPAVADEIDEYALDLLFVGGPAEPIDAAVFFAPDAGTLVVRLEPLRTALVPQGHLWACRPAASALDDEAVRLAAEPLGFVMTRTLDLGAEGSAAKLVIRKDLR